MPLSEKERKTFKRKDSRKLQSQKRKKNILIMAKKGISRESAALPKLIIRKRTIIKKNETERFKKNLNNINLERRPAAEIQIRLFLR
jgi:hypothetical protein